MTWLLEKHRFLVACGSLRRLAVTYPDCSTTEREDSGIGSCRGCAAVWGCKGGAGLLWDAGGDLAGGDHGKRAGPSASGQEWRSSYYAETAGQGQSQQKQWVTVQYITSLTSYYCIWHHVYPWRSLLLQTIIGNCSTTLVLKSPLCEQVRTGDPVIYIPMTRAGWST